VQVFPGGPASRWGQLTGSQHQEQRHVAEPASRVPPGGDVSSTSRCQTARFAVCEHDGERAPERPPARRRARFEPVQRAAALLRKTVGNAEVSSHGDPRHRKRPRPLIG
jgi:hypothetical protein